MALAGPTADQDYAQHLADYRSFLRGVGYSVAAIATLLILMAYFLL